MFSHHIRLTVLNIRVKKENQVRNYIFICTYIYGGKILWDINWSISCHLVSVVTVSQGPCPNRTQKNSQFQKLKLKFETQIWKTICIRFFCILSLNALRKRKEKPERSWELLGINGIPKKGPASCLPSR